MALIWNGQFGGLADSKSSGIAGSFAECVGIDGHSTPGVLKVHQKLTKESGATVDEFVKIAVPVSTGESFWFSADSGKIWRRSSTGTWLLVFTTSPAAGETKCLGASEYNGYLYWATESRLHRISMATAIATAANWTANAVEDWATFAVTDKEFHPMAQQDLTLFIGDGNQVASVDDTGAFDNVALDIKTPLRIKSMIDYQLDILIGTFVNDNVNFTSVIRWNTFAESWNSSDTIEEVGINAFIRDDNYVYAQAGRAGNIYFYNGAQLVPFKRIPGDFTKTKIGTINPGSVANFKGVPIFGFSNVTGNPAKQGVYSFGSYSRDYTKVLDLSWVNSQNKTESQEIGAVLVLDFDVVVAWKDTANYGVDAIDYSNKYTGAYVETMMLAQEIRDISKTLKQVEAFYESLPTSTNIVISYKINQGSYVSMATETKKDTIFDKLSAELTVPGIGRLQLKFAFTVNSNDAPVIESFGADIE